MKNQKNGYKLLNNIIIRGCVWKQRKYYIPI